MNEGHNHEWEDGMWVVASVLFLLSGGYTVASNFNTIALGLTASAGLAALYFGIKKDVE